MFRNPLNRTVARLVERSLRPKSPAFDGPLRSRSRSPGVARPVLEQFQFLLQDTLFVHISNIKNLS